MRCATLAAALAPRYEAAGRAAPRPAPARPIGAFALERAPAFEGSLTELSLGAADEASSR